MAAPLVVLDTNVLVSAVRSRRGAAFQILSAVDTGRFELALSVPLVVEYEAALLERRPSTFTDADARRLVDYLCAVGEPHEVFFLWRPWLPDPKDDMVLELAVAAGCSAVVTYHVRDFRGAERFGVRVWTPVELLKIVGFVS